MRFEMSRRETGMHHKNADVMRYMMTIGGWKKMAQHLVRACYVGPLCVSRTISRPDSTLWGGEMAVIQKGWRIRAAVAAFAAFAFALTGAGATGRTAPALHAIVDSALRGAHGSARVVVQTTG